MVIRRVSPIFGLGEVERAGGEECLCCEWRNGWEGERGMGKPFSICHSTGRVMVLLPASLPVSVSRKMRKLAEEPGILSAKVFFQFRGASGEKLSITLSSSLTNPVASRANSRLHHAHGF